MAIKKNFSSAEYFYNNNDLGNAKKVCQSILTENNKNLDAINLIADINIKEEEFDEAIKYIDMAINIDKAIVLNKKNPEVFNLKAIIHEYLNEDKKALENWNKAIELKENYAEAYFNIANYYNFNDNYEKSLDNYNKALQINKKYFLALINRADLYLKYQKYEFALLDYNLIIERDPKITRIHYNKASVLNFLGQKKSSD